MMHQTVVVDRSSMMLRRAAVISCEQGVKVMKEEGSIIITTWMVQQDQGDHPHTAIQVDLNIGGVADIRAQLHAIIVIMTRRKIAATAKQSNVKYATSPMGDGHSISTDGVSPIQR